MKLIEYIKENKELVISIAISVISIIAIVVILSQIKNYNNSEKIASSGELLDTEDTRDKYATHTTKEQNKDEITDFNNEQEQLTDKDGNIISDLDFTNADEAMEETDTTLAQEEYPYLIKVNRVMNCVTVYTKDSKGNFTVPYKAMACSTGKYINNTPTGTFKTSSKYPWRLMVDGTQSQYAYRIHGGILFHSVPCYYASKDQLEVEEFNKLGSPASLGCIRLTVEDAKWLYDNCPYGTTVEIYDDETTPGSLGKPSVIKIPLDSPYSGWDPTDPDSRNPWNNCSPTIETNEINLEIGNNLNIKDYIVAKDTCGNDAKDLVNIIGEYNINQLGNYGITLQLTDLLGRSVSKNIILNVNESKAVNNQNTTTNGETANETTLEKESTAKPTEEKPTEEKPTKEEPTKEEPTKEESTKEEPTKEEITKEETTTEDKSTEEKTTKKDNITEKETAKK